MKTFATIAFLVTLFSGCMTGVIHQSYEISAKELGIAYYYPQARLKVIQQAENKFVLTLIPGPHAAPEAPKDGFLVLGFYAVGFYCPAWRLAQKTGASAAIISFPNPSDKAAEVAEITFAQLPVRAPEARGKERIEVVNFPDENGRTVQRMWCEHPEKLNRAWTSRL